MHVPSSESEGYKITKIESSQPAPEGYQGRTDKSTQTAIGNTPATAGKKFVSEFTMSNKIKSCPLADGTSEGEGLFFVAVAYSDSTATGIGSGRIEMQARAKYKGKVDDQAVLIAPVKADIDYSYTETGNMRAANAAHGPIATAAATPIAQHFSIDVTPVHGLGAPDVGAFHGGDPTSGQLAQAYSVGTALGYWAGFYYSAAELQWRNPNRCVQISFDPPSNSRKPVPGSNMKVNAQVKTRTGEPTAASFRDGRPVLGGAVYPGTGSSDAGMPMTFTFTAPPQHADSAGFIVGALSRAGIAEEKWVTGLGSEWSGRISYSEISGGDDGSEELASWSGHSTFQISIVVKNGVGIAESNLERTGATQLRRRALRGGTIVLLDEHSTSSELSGAGSAPATVSVDFNKASGTYAVMVNTKGGTGAVHESNCDDGRCTEKSPPYSFGGLPGIGGKFDDLNHVSGSQSHQTTGLGYSHRGTATVTLTWDLAREGTTK